MQGNKLTLNFEESGKRKQIATFVTHALTEAAGPAQRWMSASS